jgi:hypothetical protein
LDVNLTTLMINGQMTNNLRLSVIAISAMLVASLFVMSSSPFISHAMAQNFTDQVGAAANQTGAAGGVANQSAMVQIPQAAMTSIMDDIETARGAVDESDPEAVDALDNAEMQLRTAADLTP